MKIGVFLEAGGNNVFFGNGVLNVLNREHIHFDHIVGFSSAGPIILAWLLGRTHEVADIFARKLNSNERNFYFFRAEHLPHNRMYQESVSELLKDYDPRNIQSDFTIFATQISYKHAVWKGALASIFLALRYGLGMNVLGYFRKYFHTKTARITRESNLSHDEMLDFIMGSSTIYAASSQNTPTSVGVE